MKLYIGNLDYTINHPRLNELFSEFGFVKDAKVVTDDTGRSKGFGFVEFENDEDAEAAIKKMDGSEHSNRKITVSKAKNQ